jgi:Pyruvate/2-oxoacid:ferredoxin oxidoreductase delta subunit
MNPQGVVAGELPVVDPCRCNNCELCVLICPTQCLRKSRLGPWLARPLDCLACAACVHVCPENALDMDDLTAFDDSQP